MSGCATNPVSGIPDFVTITEQQEISIGASYHKQILEESKIIDNKELNDYFQKLGESIAKESHRPNLKWYFTLIDDPTFNPFSKSSAKRSSARKVMFESFFVIMSLSGSFCSFQLS